jgi:HNH endonuclease
LFAGRDREESKRPRPDARERERERREWSDPKRVARYQALLESGLDEDRATSLARLQDGPYTVVLAGVRRGVVLDRSSQLVEMLHSELGYQPQAALEAAERAVHISPETVAFDLSQGDAIRLKVHLEQAGAKIKIDSSPRRDARERRPPIPETVRHEVWRRDGGRCVDCGSRENLHFDHIVAWSRGGSNTARNIELRCESCNLKKGDGI